MAYLTHRSYPQQIKEVIHAFRLTASDGKGSKIKSRRSFSLINSMRCRPRSCGPLHGSLAFNHRRMLNILTSARLVGGTKSATAVRRPRNQMSGFTRRRVAEARNEASRIFYRNVPIGTIAFAPACRSMSRRSAPRALNASGGSAKI